MFLTFPIKNDVLYRFWVDVVLQIRKVLSILNLLIILMEIDYYFPLKIAQTNNFMMRFINALGMKN